MFSKMLRGECAPREYLIGMVETPGSHDFKLMVVTDEWKYIFMANGGREQLFNRKRDPNELSNCVSSSSKSEMIFTLWLCKHAGSPVRWTLSTATNFAHSRSVNEHRRASINSTGRAACLDFPKDHRTH